MLRCVGRMTLRRRCMHRARAVPDSKMRMRRRAVRALISHTHNAIRDLRYDEDEMLRGAPLLACPAGCASGPRGSASS